ncbi:MAG: DUF4124 domain-containing protein [Deltaproteobacteria bacterium]|nr:DUF4124 domain-containing protein [Deltaproteobacteria bacterium]
MKLIILTIVAFVTLLLTSTLQAHTFYKWVDEKGTVNYTDDYNTIPPVHRGQVEIEWVHEEGPTPPIQKMTPQKREEIRKDTWGQGETYWRGKVRPWKEFLKTAEANYEKAHEKFMGKAMEFSRSRFGAWSKTQYKLNIIELDRLKGEMIKYADQIAEAREAMEKISKEAKEEKTNPDWLK